MIILTNEAEYEYYVVLCIVLMKVKDLGDGFCSIRTINRGMKFVAVVLYTFLLTLIQLQLGNIIEVNISRICFVF